ncbi:MAG: glucan 1,4-alpha-glucosidase [Candidatus Abyssobacteria bacterium SURF_5]|uniref:Glucan 1,4-alpha-glucosidase n=1 Tax=Abyssobacteria bacterium (strain SURF_5) TaxID=2093360 RepID=A0A3A4NDY3_ABYX5|nr:MAG: glucan 1,4-alpha-glucosidase [Candidatus Abyssubacteria bacterium SURF_5]
MTDKPQNDSAIAFGSPGIPPKWTSSQKEGVGTANSAASRIWFTLSHGILNEVYYPTIDHPQIRDLQFLITDGKTFFHEEKRDLKSEIECIERDTLGYRIVSDDLQRRYRLVKEIISDPCKPCILVHVRIEAEKDWLDRLQIFALLAPHLEVSGWGNSARRFHVSGQTLLIAWKEQTYLAMGTTVGFTGTSCGYVGASDGWQDLRDNLRMDWEFERAEEGNIAVIGRIDTSKSSEFTLGLAFGQGRHDAVCTLIQSLSVPFQYHWEEFKKQWRRVCCDIRDLDRFSQDNGRLYRISHNLLLAHEDKTFNGALIASASIPWGQSKGDEDIGGYHLVWTRDMVNSATGLFACGDNMTPARALVYLACSQRDDGGFPQNFWIDGTPYWSGIQLDEVAFPVMLAWRLWKAGACGGFDPYHMVRRAASYLIRQGPMTQQERWEENSGYSPSTLAASITALICAAEFCRSRGDQESASFLEDYADFLESHLELWTVTTEGTLLKGIPRHYIRIHPTDIGNPSPDEDPNKGLLAIRNRPPGEEWRFPAKDIVDAGFLELVRYGIRKPGDNLIEDSLQVVDAVLKVDTPYGPCWRRYNNDGYGERPDGGPYEGWGKGRAWPLLTGERGHYEFAAGRDPTPCISAMEKFASKGGMLPEQIWDEDDRPEAGMFFGRFAGSAMPLMWAHAEYIKLLRSAADSQVFDLIPIVAERYLAGKGRKDLEVWKPIRRVKSVAGGHVLRVQAPEPFQLLWTMDEWKTKFQTSSAPTGLEICFVDIAVPKGQTAPIRFTFFWTDTDKWEGRDYCVNIREIDGSFKKC